MYKFEFVISRTNSIIRNSIISVHVKNSETLTEIIIVCRCVRVTCSDVRIITRVLAVFGLLNQQEMSAQEFKIT